LDEMHEAVTMDSYEEGVYLLGDRRPSDAKDVGGAL
jgi:3,4-dihydroxy 2-butanone 4-phosphate synthase / GTP cyclohydrolase II